MPREPTFTVERDGDRVVLVPDFWPSDLDGDASHKYEGLRSLHVVDDGAITMPCEYLPAHALEPGSTLSLAAVWSARTTHRGDLDGGPYAAGGFERVEADRDRIAHELLETHQDCWD